MTNTSLIRRPAPPTEPCGGCGAAVDTSSRYAVRSRFTGRAQCDRCGTADHAEYLAVSATPLTPRSAPEFPETRVAFDAGLVACARCQGTMLETVLSARGKYSGAAVCEPCANGSYRNEVRRPYPVTTPERSRAYAEQQLEAWRSRTPEMVEELDAMLRGADRYELEFYAQRTDASLYGTAAETPWEARHQHDEDEYEEDDDEARVVRVDHDGRSVYAPEPDGVPLAGRQYESRFWAPDSTSEVRDTWVGHAEWVTR